MKRWISFFMILTILCSLAACTNGEEETEPVSQAADPGETETETAEETDTETGEQGSSVLVAYFFVGG